MNILNPNRDYPLTAFRLRFKRSASKSFLTVQFMDITLNPDLKRFRYLCVDRAYVWAMDVNDRKVTNGTDAKHDANNKYCCHGQVYIY